MNHIISYTNKKKLIQIDILHILIQYIILPLHPRDIQHPTLVFHIRPGGPGALRQCNSEVPQPAAVQLAPMAGNPWNCLEPWWEFQGKSDRQIYQILMFYDFLIFSMILYWFSIFCCMFISIHSRNMQQNRHGNNPANCSPALNSTRDYLLLRTYLHDISIQYNLRRVTMYEESLSHWRMILCICTLHDCFGSQNDS